jgi:hypothetical protein
MKLVQVRQTMLDKQMTDDITEFTSSFSKSSCINKVDVARVLRRDALLAHLDEHANIQRNRI